MKQKHFIDVHKGLTFIVVLALMAFYQRWDNPTAWVYLALHGSYGFAWLLKSRFFPDKQWEQPVGLAYGGVIFGGLGLYWLAPWLLTAGDVQAPGWYLGLCITLYALGMFLHYAADMHKHMALSLQPGRLITDGLWSLCRNPNYLGELLIYLGFGLLAMHWLPVVILAAWVAVIWVPNMLKKDRSLARYPEFAAYQRRTRLIIPFVL